MATADDDLVGGAVHKPCGYGKFTLTGVCNLDDITQLTTGKRLTTTKGRPIRALIQAETQAITWTDDGDVDPAAAVGLSIAVGATLEYDGDLSKIRLFPKVAGAVAHVAFYSI